VGLLFAARATGGDLAGLPVLYVDPDILASDATDDLKAIREQYKQILANIRVDQQTGVLLPSTHDDKGNKTTELTLLGTGSRRQNNTDGIIKRYAQNIASVILADFILIGHEGVGSFALVEQKYDMFVLSLGAHMNSIASVFNKDAIVKLFRINGFPTDRLPKLVPGELEHQDLKEVSLSLMQLVNAGAITTTSLVAGSNANDIWKKISDTYDAFAGRKLTVLEDVYKSEAATNQRNKAIGALMFAYGHISENPDRATDIYTRQCSVGVNTRDLAMMAATLANNGVNPVTGRRVLDAVHVPGLLAVMATAGLYDDTGQWLFKTGLPAKSGVGGGLIAVSPGNWGIAVISPPLDAAGNSVRAQRAIADISAALGGNPYAVGRTGTAAGTVRSPR
jgi:hypothetical protein